MTTPYNYNEIGRINIGGNPTDIASIDNKIYITNYTQNISVVDTISSTIVTSINSGSGTISIDIDLVSRHAYAINSFSEKLQIIDLNTDEIVKELDIDKTAKKVVVDSFYNKIYILNILNKSLTVIKYQKKNNNTNLWFVDNVFIYDKKIIDISLNNIYHTINVIFDPFDIITDNDRLVQSIDISSFNIKQINSENYNILDIENTNNLSIAYANNQIISNKIFKNSNGEYKKNIEILDTNSNILASYEYSNYILYTTIKYNSDINKTFLLSDLSNEISILDNAIVSGQTPSINTISVGKLPVAIAFAKGVIPSATPTSSKSPTPTPTITPSITNTLTPTKSPTPTPVICSSIIVSANTNFRRSEALDTQFYLNSGNRIYVVSTGLVVINDIEIPRNADGIPYIKYDIVNPDNTITNVNAGSLVGKIGINGSIFSLGSRSEIIAQTTGRLYLGIVDDDGSYTDNFGEFYVNLLIENICPTRTPTQTPTQTITPTITPTLSLTPTPVQCLINNGQFFNDLDQNIINGDIPGWESYSVDLYKWGNLSTHYAVDLNSSSTGYISQTINTVSGQIYTLKFNYAGNNYTISDNNVFDKTFNVKISNSNFIGSDYSFNIAPYMKYFTSTIGPTYDDMGWKTDSITFIANSTSSKITFASTCPTCTSYGPIIDNVCVETDTCRCSYVIPATPTPTPSTTITSTPTNTTTKTLTPTNTPTNTVTPTITASTTSTPTTTPTITPTKTTTPTITPTSTDPTISRAYISNYGSNSISIVHTITQKLLNTINNINKPIRLIRNTDGSIVYVLSENSNVLTSINTSSYAITTINISDNILDMALNSSSNLAFGLKPDSVTIFDVSNGSIITTISIGSNNQKISYAYNGSVEKLYVFDTNKIYVITLPINVNNYPNTLWENNTFILPLTANYRSSVLNTEDNSLYLGLTDNHIYIYDIINNPSLITSLNINNTIDDIGINRQNGDAYFLSSDAGVINIFDTDTNNIKTTVSLPSTLTTKISVSDNGLFYYVIDNDNASIYLYNVANNTLLNTITVGQNPNNIILLNSIRVTPTPTPSTTKTQTPTPTNTNTPTNTSTPTITPSITSSPTQSPIPPYIITQPSNYTAIQQPAGNGAATFEVVAGPSYVVYEWQVSTDDGISWTTIPNSNNSYLDIYNLTKLNNNQKYRVLILNNFGSVYSDVVLLTVLGPSISILSNPTDQTISIDNTATFTVSITGIISN